MARKKASFEDWVEKPDEAAVEVEVSNDGYNEPASDDDLSVNITNPEQPAAAEPELSETTKAEMEAGRKVLEERARSKQVETGEPEETV